MFKKINFTVLIIFVLLHVYHPSTYADSPVVTLKKSVSQIFLGPYCEILEDRDNHLTIEEIASSNPQLKWKEVSKKILTFSMTKSALWFRFIVNNPLGKGLYLEIDNPVLNIVEFYSAGEDGRYNREQLGDHFPFTKRKVFDKSFIFEISKYTGTRTFYFKILTTSTIQFMPQLWFKDLFYKKYTKGYSLYWIYYGLLLALAIYNLFVFFITREKSYFYIVMIIAGWGLNQLLNDGFGNMYLWPQSTWLADSVYNISVSFLFIFLGLYMRRVLESWINFPLMDKLLISYVAIGFILLILSLFLGSCVLTLSLLLSTYSSFVNIVIIVYAVIKGNRTARYLLAAILLYNGINALVLFDVLIGQSSMFLFNWGSKIASICLVMFLAFVLADKMQLMKIDILVKHDKILSQNKEIEASNEELMATNEELEASFESLNRMNSELHVSEDKFKSLFEHAGDCIIIYDIDGKILDANELTAVSLDYSRSKIKELSIYDIEKYSKSETILERLKTLRQKEHLIEETFYCSSKGDKIPMELNCRIINLSGKQAILSIARNISNRLKTQEMMIQTEKMITIGGLSAGIAHEINNPLSIIVLSVKAAMDRLSLTSKKNIERAEKSNIDLNNVNRFLKESKVLHYLENTYSAGIRAADIVKNMLQFSRKSEAIKESANINEVIDRSISIISNDYDFKNKYDFKKIKIIRNYREKYLGVKCIAAEIEQVIINLLKNASQAISWNTNESFQGKINITTEIVNEICIITLQDNGPGMDSDTQKKIFEPFYTTKPEGVGTGLGLSVSLFIINNKHSGNIEIESTLGKGTTFKIFLPVDQV